MAELRKNGGTLLFQASSVGLCQLHQWLIEGHLVYTMIGLKQGFSYATSTRMLGVVGDFLDTSKQFRHVCDLLVIDLLGFERGKLRCETSRY